jgi:hypothetical protein
VLTISNDEKLTLENQYVANMFYSRLVILKPHIGRMRQSGVTNNLHLRCIAALNHAAYCLFDAVAPASSCSPANLVEIGKTDQKNLVEIDKMRLKNLVEIDKSTTKNLALIENQRFSIPVYMTMFL